VMPSGADSDFYQSGHSLYASLYPALKPIFQRIARL